ncbi:D-inositol-3-phosphate glycosyltransferase [Mycolicibacterium vanbaalenii]|uniref:D-inositol-3-phosphate glycosyltransferase n=1 Tax=Mycolicibacterium vanbaalenii TaxID=110539 RepID=A0A5S9R4J4_MYCVN|nr:glycosyltransferase family 1 protein [Mycolicibacterium vanbaalenii]CAA0128265.1 D-inositol-3-phosphate glycosyltransferase [Mycolicibacterium vanbaalenii]
MTELRTAAPAAINGKWLAQSASGTQRYASQVMEAFCRLTADRDLLLVLPSDAPTPPWAADFQIARSRLRGNLFEQLALPWLTRGRHLYSMAGPAPLLKRNQTVVMHDAMPFRMPTSYRRTFVLWYLLMYGLLSRTVVRALTVSSFSRTELAQTLHVPEQRFELAPCGSDHLTPGNGAGYVAPFEPGTFALIVGNLAPHKNVGPAAAALVAAGVPVVVVGVAQQVHRQATIADNALLRYIGRIGDDHLHHLYADAGVLVAPSKYEGFGIPVVEAARAGCPSVFALGSAMTEVAGPGGLGFPADNLNECVRLAKSVLADPALRGQLAERGRANAERFTWERTARIIFGDTAVRDHKRGSEVRA